jgi:hypothetical protein
MQMTIGLLLDLSLENAADIPLNLIAHVRQVFLESSP